MDSAFVIELPHVTAGIIVRESRSYRFYAADHRFRSLEGRTFGSPDQAEAAARAVGRSSPSQGRPESRDGSVAEPAALDEPEAL